MELPHHGSLDRKWRVFRLFPEAGGYQNGCDRPLTKLKAAGRSIPDCDVMTTDDVRLAAIHYQAGFWVDSFMAKLEEMLRASDLRLGGAVQVNAPDACTACSDMTLLDLSSGTRMEISQQLGSQSQSCRLDSERMAGFAGMLDRPLDGGIDLMIFNKFGKAESEGHGLRRTLARAIEAGIPVLTAVRPPYDEAWRRFHEGLAVELPPDLQRVHDWCVGAARQRRHAPQSSAPA
jgi:hypothetical protein